MIATGVNERNNFWHNNSTNVQTENTELELFGRQESESIRQTIIPNDDKDMLADQTIRKDFKHSYEDTADAASPSTDAHERSLKYADENIVSIKLQESYFDNETSTEARQQTETSQMSERSAITESSLPMSERSLPISERSPVHESPLNERNTLNEESQNCLGTICRQESQLREWRPQDVRIKSDETKHNSIQQLINARNNIVHRKAGHHENGLSNHRNNGTQTYPLYESELHSEPTGVRSQVFGTPVVAGFDVFDHFIPVVKSTTIQLTDLPLLSPIIKGEEVSIPFFDNDYNDTKDQYRTRDADTFFAQIVDNNAVEKGKTWMSIESRVRSEVDPPLDQHITNEQKLQFKAKAAADEMNEIESVREVTNVLHLPLLDDSGISMKSQEENVFGNLAPPLSGSFEPLSEKSSILNGASTVPDVQGILSFDNIANTFSMTESLNHSPITSTAEETLDSTSNSFREMDSKAQSEIDQSIAPTFSITSSNMNDKAVAKYKDDATTVTLPHSLTSQDDNFGKVATNANIEVAQTFSSLSCTRNSDKTPSLFLSISDEVYSNLERPAADDSDGTSNGTDIVVEKSNRSNAQRNFNLNSRSNDQQETYVYRSEVDIAPLLTLESSGMFALGSQSTPLDRDIIVLDSGSAIKSEENAEKKDETYDYKPPDCNTVTLSQSCFANDKQKLVAPGVDVLVVKGMIVEPEQQLTPMTLSENNPMVFANAMTKDLNYIDGKTFNIGGDVAKEGNRENKKAGNAESNLQLTSNEDEELVLASKLAGQTQEEKLVIQEIESIDELEIESKGNTTGDFGVILRTFFCGDLAAVPSSEKKETKSVEDVCWTPFSKKGNNIDESHEVETEANFNFPSPSKSNSPEAIEIEKVSMLKSGGQSSVESKSQLMNTPKSGNVGYSPRSRPECTSENVNEQFFHTASSRKRSTKGINLIDVYSDSMSTNKSDANEGIAPHHPVPKTATSNESEVFGDTKSNFSKNMASLADEKIKDQSESTWDPSTIESQSMQSRAVLGSIQERPVVPLEISVTTPSAIQSVQDFPASTVQQQLKPVASMEYSGSGSESTESSESDYSSEKPEIPLEIAFEGGPSTMEKAADSILSVLSHATTASESLEITKSFDPPLHPSTSEDVLGVVQKLKSQHAEKNLKSLETPTSQELFAEVTDIDINETTPSFSFERNEDTNKSMGAEAKPHPASRSLTSSPVMPTGSDTFDVKTLLSRYDKIVRNIAALDEHKRNLNDEQDNCRMENLIEMPEKEYVFSTISTQTEYFGEETILLPSDSINVSMDRMVSKSESFVSNDLIDLTLATSADSRLISERIPGPNRMIKQHEIDAQSIGTHGPAVEVLHLQKISTASRSMESPSFINKNEGVYTYASMGSNSASGSGRIRTPTSAIMTKNSSNKSVTTTSAGNGLESDRCSNKPPLINAHQAMMTSLSDLNQSTEQKSPDTDADNDVGETTQRLTVTEGGSSLKVENSITDKQSFTKSKASSEVRSIHRLMKSSSSQSKQSQEIGDLFSRYDQIVQQMVILDSNRFELAKSKQLLHYSNSATSFPTNVDKQSLNEKPMDKRFAVVPEIDNHGTPNEDSKLNHRSNNITEAVATLPIVETKRTNISLQSAKSRLSARSQRSFLSLPNRRNRKGYHQFEGEKKDSSLATMPISAHKILSLNSNSSNSQIGQRILSNDDSSSETSKQAEDRLDESKQQLASPSSSTQAVALSSSLVGTQRATELHKVFIENEADDTFNETKSVHSPSNSSIDIFTKFDKLLMARMDCSTYQPGEPRNSNDQVQGMLSIVSNLSDGHLTAYVENKKLHALAKETVNLPNIAISSPTLSNVSSFVHVNVRSSSPTFSDATIDRRAETVVSPSSRFQDREDLVLGPISATEDAQKHRSFSGMHSRRAGWVHREQDVSDENDSLKMVALTKVEVSKNEENKETNQKIEFIFESILPHDDHDDEIFHALSDTTATEVEIQMEYSEDELHPPPPQTEATMQGLHDRKGAATTELDNFINSVRTDEGDDTMSSPRYVFSSSYSNSSYEDSEVQMQQIESIIHGLRSAEGEMSSPRSGWSLSNNSPRSNFGGSQRGSESVAASSPSNRILQTSPRKGG